ncbi:hypothetical protein ACHAWF_007837 [Thalassiosira exigua]
MHSSPNGVTFGRRPSRPSIASGLSVVWLLLGRPVAAAAFPSTSSKKSPRTSRPPASSFPSPPAASPAPRHRSLRPMSSLGASEADIVSSSSPTKWSDALGHVNSIYRRNAQSLFPPLTASSHKGSHGRIAIFGGSEKYTGAPYYAAQSALNCGIDLVTVFTAKEASVPLKCYSPELMVQSVYSVEELDVLAAKEEAILKELEQCKQSSDLMTHEMNERELSLTMSKLEHSEERQRILVKNELEKDDKMEVLVERLAKMKRLEGKLQKLRERQRIVVGGIAKAIAASFPTLHALCIGPGLGRHPLVFLAAEEVIREAIESGLTLVLDADALYMLSLERHRTSLEALRNYERCVMTPNAMEMRRLDQAIPSNNKAGDDANNCSNIVVQKGHADVIRQGLHAMHCEEEGGLKRSGGIGDVLAGTISAFMAWNAILERSNPNNFVRDDGNEPNQRAFASWSACCAVKRATRAAYQNKRRAMSAIDVMGEIGGVIEGMEEGL